MRPTRRLSSYANELRPHLSAQAFQPARSRLCWLPLNLGVIGGATWAVTEVGPALGLVLSVVIGCAFAGLVFLGHEVLHGAVVRGMHARRLVGWVAFLPFVVSPRLWVAWHNRVHHGNANRAGVDPDAYPTLDEYHASSTLRLATNWFSIGRNRLRGLTSLLVGFSVQSLHMLLVARKRRYLTARQHRLALLETCLGIAVWGVLLAVLGP